MNSILVQMFEVDFNIVSHFSLVPRLEAFGSVPSILRMFPGLAFKR